MATLNTEELSVNKQSLHAPPLIEVAEVLSAGLKENFNEVSVKVVDCPNLSEPPFHLVRPGLSGNPHIFDIGGVPYLIPTVSKEKIYDLPAICKLAEIEPIFAIGAGGGPWPFINTNCEGMFNLSVIDGKLNQQSRIASVDPIGAAKTKGKCKLEILPQNEKRCALLVNILVSQGKPGKVLEVICNNRIKNEDYITSIRKCLESHYKDKSVGLGGVFLLKEGWSKNHVMPTFSSKPLNSDDDVNEWLHFFNMSSPLINVGTLISHDPGLDLRVQHFHAFSNHGEGGHYHNDTTPNNVKYIGYFIVAETIVRVDAPQVTHTIGRD